MKYLAHLKDIVDSYDIYLVDQWGVLHNGVQPFLPALEALAQLKKIGKTVIILSNSSQPRKFTADFLQKLRFTDQHYDFIITSGSDFQDNILHPRDGFYQNLGKNCYVLSWQQDLMMANGKMQHATLPDLPLNLVGKLDDADFILCAGINRDKKLEDYTPLLEQAKSLSLPMVCINPDKYSVNVEGEMELCPGTIADSYERDYHGSVRWHGKPYPSIYQAAAHFAGRAIDHRFLAIGDSLDHDIKGIKDAGGDGLFLTSGIAWQDLGLKNQFDIASNESVEKYFQQKQIFADYVQNQLIW